MALGFSVFLIALGAVLTWGVDYDAAGVDLNVVGIILLIVGAVGALLSLVWAGSVRERVIERDERVVPRR
jgi:hypothetical protein